MSSTPNPPDPDSDPDDVAVDGPRDPIEGAASSPSLEAGLYVVATPIGNLRDITLRALDVLRGVDLILAEDTRVTRKLLNAHGISTRVARCDEHATAAMIPRVTADLAAGARIALVSDAGTPLVSDPGDRIVQAAIEAGARVIPIPGASAALAALVTSGLGGGVFTFAGFPPPKAQARRAFLAGFADAPGALILFETGPRLADSLTDMAAVFGTERPAAVARELTKMFEEVRRGPLGELALLTAGGDPPKGELVVVIAPAPPPAAADEDTIDAALRAAMATQPLKSAVAEVAASLGAPRKQVYARALALRDAD